MALALVSIARFMTRGLYATINSIGYWYQTLEISSEVLSELRFCLFNLEKYNGQSIWHSTSTVCLVYSDASSTGHGGYTIEHELQIAHGPWS